MTTAKYNNNNNNKKPYMLLNEADRRSFTELFSLARKSKSSLCLEMRYS